MLQLVFWSKKDFIITLSSTGFEYRSPFGHLLFLFLVNASKSLLSVLQPSWWVWSQWLVLPESVFRVSVWSYMVLYGCNIWHNQSNQRSLKSVSHCKGLPSSPQMHLKLPRDYVFVRRCKACVHSCRCAHTRKWKFKTKTPSDLLVLGRHWGHQVWNGSEDAWSACPGCSLVPCTSPHPLGCC